MNNSEAPKKTRRRVFLSYARADKLVAERVAEALRRAELRVWFDSWELASGDSIALRIEEAVASSDVLLVLLSPKSVASKWLQDELNAGLAQELRDRAITVIPALIEDCVIPALLTDRQFLDLRHDVEGGIEQLIGELNVIPDIDFSRLDPRTFEGLVGDLLTELGFSVQDAPVIRDSGFDFIAGYESRDPFGAKRKETWVVEAKFYREQRLSVSTLRQMLGYLVTSRRQSKGLIVTNGRMTSVAREFLSEITEESGQELRVIDGTDLTNLLIQHPQLVERYFKSDKG